MDFHSLTRKELQTLCKRNKIPANITNVAMADALKALEIVEGLEEFMNQSQSPEKTMNKSSQEIPSTVTRTSTRRKTTEEEPQSTQPTTRTRKTTRTTMELDEENKNVNVPETPVMATTTRRRAQKTEPELKEQKKSDLLETPASQSGRRKKGPKETVQQGYGTRRSVRLLEKCMTGLSLKASEKMEPVKIVEVVEGEVENKNGQSGATSEVPLARNLSASLEDERELKDDVLENSKCHNGESGFTLISEAGSYKSENLGSLSALDTKDVSPNEKNDEPEGEDKLADIPDGIIDPKGSDDIAVSEDSYEIVNLNEKLVADETDDVAVSEDSYEIDNLNEELVADETKSIDVLVADASEDTSEEVLNHSSSADMEPIEVVSVKEYANHAPQEIECQKLLGKDCDINAVHDDLNKLPEAEEYDEGKASQNVSVLPKGHMDSSEKKGNEESDDDQDEIVPGLNIVDVFLGDSDIDDDTGSDNISLADELQEEVSCEQKSISIPTAAYNSEDPMTNMVDEEALVDVNEESDDDQDEIVPGLNIVDAFLGDSDIDDDTGSDNISLADELQEVSCEQKSISIPIAAYNSEDPMTNMVDEEALVDVNVAEAATILVSSFHNASQSVVDDIPVHKMVNYGDGEALVDVCVKPAEEFAETAQEIPPPEEKSPTAAKLMTTSIPLSPLTAQFSQPTRFTPRKSSSKKQTTIPKVMQVLDNINKENIDNNSVKEVEPCLGKVKKTKNIIDEETMQNLEGMSLRNLKKLTKMFDKLEITDNMKNKEDKNVSKQQPFGKSRPALQTLPQNSTRTGEAEKQN